MIDIEYKARFDQVLLLVRILVQTELNELHEVVQRAETIGPFVDPTAWIHRGGGRNVQDQRDVLEALMTCQAALLRIDSVRFALEALNSSRAAGEGGAV